jgi:hypothetical protein
LAFENLICLGGGYVRGEECDARRIRSGKTALSTFTFQNF